MILIQWVKRDSFYHIFVWTMNYLLQVHLVSLQYVQCMQDWPWVFDNGDVIYIYVFIFKRISKGFIYSYMQKM